MVPAAAAQDTRESTANLWLDGTAYWRFDRGWALNTDGYFRTVMSGADNLTSVGVRPELQRNFGFIDALGGANVRFNDDAGGLDYWELRPYLGIRFVGSPFSRLELRSYTRLEYREFLYTGSDSTDSQLRFRTRVEAEALVSGQTFSSDRTWSVQGDIEAFADLTDAVEERFADRLRLRLGVDHRRSYGWRFEGFLVYQVSRNTQMSGVTSSDFYLRLRVKHYFR